MACVDCQGVIMSQTRHHAHHVAVNVAGGEQASATDLVRRAPGRDVLLESVIDGLGAATIFV
jgi:hypothetical protein